MFGEKAHLADLIFNVCLAFFGGAVKLLTSNLKHKTLSKYVASAVIGGFAGLLTYCLCINFNMNVYMTAFATGIAGYMGDSILNLFSQVLPKMFEKKININIENEKKGGK